MTTPPRPRIPMPPILYGTAWKKSQTKQLVVQAVLNGFRGIDTACQPKHYREDLVGEALVELRERHGIQRESLFLQTKFTSIDGQDLTQPLPYDPTDPIRTQVHSSIQRSLRNLHTTYLDSVVLHSPLRTRSLTLEAYRALEDFKRQGVIGVIGVSNCYEEGELRWLSGVAEVREDQEETGVGVVQNRWYEGNGWDRDGVRFAHANGARYQSFWTLTGSPSLLTHPLILRTARSHSLTPEQTIYALCARMGITPLCGTTKVGRMKQALKAVEVGVAGGGEGIGEEEWEGLRRLVE